MPTRFVVLAAALVPATLAAQRAVPTVSLPAADARFEQPFGSIIGLRELSDGRIIVADPNDLGLVVADFRTQSTTAISRKGSGPGEYGRVARLYAAAGDSTLMPDLAQRRWLILDGDRVVVTVPPDNPVVKATQGLVLGSDRLGHVVRIESPDTPNGESITGARDSTTVVLYHRGTGVRQPLTRLLERPAVRTITRNARGEISSSSSRALRLRVGEQYLLHHDGWLAVVRINPFRVDWRSPDGRWTTGAPLPVPVLRMTEREKQASLGRTARSNAANPSPFPLPPALQTPEDEWPEVMPPYIQGELMTSPDGGVLIRRQPSADRPGVAYYAVDRQGRLSGILELKDNERVINAVGARWLYVQESDADDLRYIRRHPWRLVRLPG